MTFKNTSYQDKLALTRNNSQGKISTSVQSSGLRACLPQTGSADLR